MCGEQVHGVDYAWHAWVHPRLTEQVLSCGAHLRAACDAARGARPQGSLRCRGCVPRLWGTLTGMYALCYAHELLLVGL